MIMKPISFIICMSLNLEKQAFKLKCTHPLLTSKEHIPIDTHTKTSFTKLKNSRHDLSTIMHRESIKSPIENIKLFDQKKKKKFNKRFTDGADFPMQ